VGVPHLVHRLQSLGSVDEGLEDVHHLGGRADIQWLAIDQLHEQEGFGHLQEHGLYDFQLEGAAQVGVGLGVGKLARDLVLGLHLLDEAQVLLFSADHVLQGEDLFGGGIDDGVDGASRTFSQSLQNFIVEEFLGHADGSMSPPSAALHSLARQVGCAGG
jgi:hypothetical protein